MSTDKQPDAFLEQLFHRARNQLDTLQGLQTTLNTTVKTHLEKGYNETDKPRISNTLSSLKTSLPVIIRTADRLKEQKERYLKYGDLPDDQSTTSSTGIVAAGFQVVLTARSDYIEESQYGFTVDDIQGDIDRTFEKLEIILGVREELYIPSVEPKTAPQWPFLGRAPTDPEDVLDPIHYDGHDASTVGYQVSETGQQGYGYAAESSGAVEEQQDEQSAEGGYQQGQNAIEEFMNFDDSEE